MGIIVLDAPPGGRAAALFKESKKRRTMPERYAPRRRRFETFAFSPIQWGMKLIPAPVGSNFGPAMAVGGEKCAIAGCMRVH
jgi:hypothetical protein